MMLRGGGGQEEGRVVLPCNLSSGPRAHQGEAGLTYQEPTSANQSISEMVGWHVALGITLGMVQLPPASASGDHWALQAEHR